MGLPSGPWRALRSPLRSRRERLRYQRSGPLTIAQRPANSKPAFGRRPNQGSCRLVPAQGLGRIDGPLSWSGATPTTAMPHIATQQAPDGKGVEWMVKATDGIPSADRNALRAGQLPRTPRRPRAVRPAKARSSDPAPGIHPGTIYSRHRIPALQLIGIPPVAATAGAAVTLPGSGEGEPMQAWILVLPLVMFAASAAAGDLDAVADIYAQDYVYHGQGGLELHGLAAARTVAASILAASEDRHAVVEQQFASGDVVVTRFTSRGTLTGPWHGVEPSGQLWITEGIDISRIEDGKIAEDWEVIASSGLQERRHSMGAGKDPAASCAVSRARGPGSARRCP